MDLHQRFIENILDPLDLWRIGEYSTVQYQREFRKSQFWGREKIDALQLSLIQELVQHAYQNCPFYTKAFQQAEFHPDDLNCLDDVARIPILEKSHIQRHRDSMLDERVTPDSVQLNQTGGSTGSPVSFYLNHDRKCSREAAARRHDEWAGWRVGDKVALVWGATPDLPVDTLKARLRNALLDRRLVLDTSSLSDEKIRDFHENFEQFRPKVILAYAQSLVLVTRHLMSIGKKLAHHPQSIVTSAEVLSAKDRQLLEGYFGCKVFNRYGCREVSVVASECEAHDGMHIMAEGLYVEIVDGDRVVAPGERGEIVITDLRNKTMPLIRYRIGDVSSLNYQPCACGRSLPRLEGVQGRKTDFLIAADGQLVSGCFIAQYLLAERPSLGQVQIHQKRRNHVLFRFTGVGQSTVEQEADVEFLRAATAQHLGEGTAAEFEIVDSIANSGSGKFIFCKSDVSTAEAMGAPAAIPIPTTGFAVES